MRMSQNLEAMASQLADAPGPSRVTWDVFDLMYGVNQWFRQMHLWFGFLAYVDAKLAQHDGHSTLQ